MTFEASTPREVSRMDGGEVRLYAFSTEYLFDEAPNFVSLTVSNVTYHSEPPIITVVIVRPDGRELVLYRHAVSGPRLNEEPPISRYGETPFRVYLSGDESVASAVSDFYRNEFGIDLPSRELRWSVDRAIFGQPVEGGFEVLKGIYGIMVELTVYDPSDSVGFIRFTIGGSVYGLMGTDGLGRDLAVGLLFGFPVALTIGIVTATLTTFAGTLLGILGGYVGGKTDMLVQRASDILNNVPLLPILIFLSFILGQRLWITLLILVAFGWPGMSIVIRSMVLQIKSGQLIEAARALGASRSRIMLRHIFPELSSFIFAQMIFFTPSAILAEAGLSFLGLGDPSIPTWGQILEQGFRSGGAYVGYWWWVVPPGLLVVLTAMTFVLLSLGVEEIVDPRLRRIR